MVNLQDIRYVRLGTRDVDAAARYATTILGLEEAGRDAGAVYLRSDARDHTLVYFEGDPADHTVAFEVADGDALEAAAAEIEAHRLPVRLGTREECELRRVERFLQFRDPSGNGVDLVVRPFHSGRRHFPARDAGITGFSHVGLRTTDAVRDEAFWTRVCNARVSDRIGAAPLLRIDAVHHRIALFPSTYAGRPAREPPGRRRRRHHARVLLPARTRRAHRVRARPPSDVVGDLPLLRRAGRHGVRVLDRRAARSRTRPTTGRGSSRSRPSSFCMWGSRPDIPEFRR